MLSNPWFGGIAGVCSIISIPLGIYLFSAGLERPDITFLVSGSRGILYQKNPQSSLKLSFDDKPIDSDVYIAQIAIWNRGKRPVRREDFLITPRIIVASDGARIIEASVRAVTRQETQFSRTFDPAADTGVSIDWKVLEMNDGGVCQVIYTGTPDTTISVDGVIIGQRQFSSMKTSPVPHKPQSSFISTSTIFKLRLYFWVAVIIMALVLPLMILGAIQLNRSASRTSKIFYNALVAAVAVCFVMTIISGIKMLDTTQYKPPFDF